MYFLGYYFGLSKQTEVLLLTVIGICYTIFDESLIHLNSNLRKVWDLALDSISFSTVSQTYIKYILSGVVLVRSFTVHLNLAFYIVMLWPAIFEERPALLLPWLLVGVIKSLLMNAVTLMVGIYICVFSHYYKSVCIDFFLTQLLDYAPSFYMWFCVFSYYKELKTVTTVDIVPLLKSSYNSAELALRRRKVRSMSENSDLNRRIAVDEERHLVSVSTIESFVQQIKMHLPKTSRSLDTLLAAMAAEAGLMGECEETRSEVVGATLQEKAKKFLKLTDTEIIDAQLHQNSYKNDLFSESMLLVCNFEDESRKFEIRRQELTSDSLKATGSEKQINHSNYKLAVSSEALSDISEIEIRPVLNYSTTSLSTIKDAFSLSDKILQQKIGRKRLNISKSFIPVRIPYYRVPILTYYIDVASQAENYTNKICRTTQFPSQHEIQKSSRMRDFTCQASTLSRNILKLTNLDFLKNFRHHSKLVSKPILSNNLNKCTTELQNKFVF